MKTPAIAVAALSIALLSTVVFPTVAGAVIVSVDCSVPDSINAAIASIAPPTLVEVEITNGPCAEDVIIRRDNVIIRPDPAGTPPFSITGAVVANPDAEDATVLIRDSRRVTLDGITVNGGRYGVRVVASQENIIFNNVSIDNNAVWGIQALQASNVIVEGSSSFADNGRGGISVADAGAVTCRPCVITGSNGFGIRAVQGAIANVLNASSINVTGRGIFAEDSRVKVDSRGVNSSVIGTTAGIAAVNGQVEVLDQATIQATGGSGVAIDATNGSTVRVGGAAAPFGAVTVELTATGGSGFALLLDGNSEASVVNAFLTGGVSARGTSHAIIETSQQLSTNVNNGAIEASFLGTDSATLVGSTILTAFSTGRFAGSTLENLDCRQKSDAICQGGTSITGTSGCGDCIAGP